MEALLANGPKLVNRAEPGGPGGNRVSPASAPRAGALPRAPATPKREPLTGMAADFAAESRGSAHAVRRRERQTPEHHRRLPLDERARHQPGDLRQHQPQG